MPEKSLDCKHVLYRRKCHACYESDRTRLEAELAAEREKREALESFAREAFATAFDGGTWDGADIQEKGAELGLLREEPFDPEKHPGVDASEFEPGETIYVFTELMRGRDEIAAGGSHDR